MHLDFTAIPTDSVDQQLPSYRHHLPISSRLKTLQTAIYPVKLCAVTSRPYTSIMAASGGSYFRVLAAISTVWLTRRYYMPVHRADTQSQFRAKFARYVTVFIGRCSFAPFNLYQPIGLPFVL